MARQRWELEPAVMLPAKTGPSLARWLADDAPPALRQWVDWPPVGQVRIDARGGTRAAVGRVREAGHADEYWAAWCRGDAEAQYLAGRWLTLARYYAQALAVLRHDRTRRAIALGKPVERVAGELSFIDSYRVDMGRLEALLERELGGAPQDGAGGA